VSQVTERLWQEYEAFGTRDLREFAVAYFFVDGVAERLHAAGAMVMVTSSACVVDRGR